MIQPKKLIEVAMPIKEISAECVRDIRVQHGHISSLHQWWARRPLPVCRAVVFASLVPDPLDENCSAIFKEAVDLLLKDEEFSPYKDIPYTSAIDPLENNLRTRLLSFIGKFSLGYSDYLLHKSEKYENDDILTSRSLIKWESRNDSTVINIARKLIWVAYNVEKDKTLKELLHDYDIKINSIEKAQAELCLIKNRHLDSDLVKQKEDSLNRSINQFLENMPIVFDPFAGGGAIPLEAARLGCRAYGNDLNPVAHIIQRAGLEFPQKFGKPIVFTKEEYINKYGTKKFNSIKNENKIFKEGECVAIDIPNRLSHDVEFYANELFSISDNEISKYYSFEKNKKPSFAYYWARVGTCSNTSCGAKIPLLRQFYLSNKKTKQTYLNPIINKNQIEFEIKNGECKLEPWIDRGNVVCPCCGNVTENNKLKNDFLNGKTSYRMLAVIYEGKKGKEYRKPNNDDINVLELLQENVQTPNEEMPVKYTQAFPCCTWGFDKWGKLFSSRQLNTMNTLLFALNSVKEQIIEKDELYKNAIITYLAFLIDRSSTRMTSFVVWNPGAEKIQPMFGRQAIPMVFDFPEANPINEDGPVKSQLSWILKYIDSESNNFNSAFCINASSGNVLQFPFSYLDAIVTDPPYYDAIAYADVSDFYYVWLKKSLGEIFVNNFSTPQTPKSEECTALKHHHDNDIGKSKKHFEKKLTEIFSVSKQQTKKEGIVSIMFAHQSTEAWTTLCNSILQSGMNISGSWAIDSEITGATKTNKSFLSSSVTVSARPVDKIENAAYKSVKSAIEKNVTQEVEKLYKLGFRGADLLTACFGQAVSEFGKYEKVEKADGSEVTVAELLEMARESAFNALLKGFDGDDFTKFYIGWLQLYSFAESEFDDAAKFSRVGLSINVAELFTEHILIKNGNKQTLGTFEERIKANKNIGDRANNFLIDLVHRAMALYKGNNRTALLQYIGKVAAQPESNFWRVVTSLCEVLPAGSEDHKQALGLLTNKDSLIRESKTFQTITTNQTKLFELE